ncbi:MAG: 4-hydroxythreonine-4-phosphate dehydrogenase PdxA [Verrucomicrobiota bacterium]|nr:4-hydroxythreonine-4-phosphate dehydrogenase PdxA [Verrucomicrobiota bacterium]
MQKLAPRRGVEEDMMHQRIGITLGDPAGIGPEIVRAALQSKLLPTKADYVVVGNYAEYSLGQPTLQTARAAVAALEEAVTSARRGELAAIVTGPIHKARMYEAGFKFPGQTEFFAERCGVKNFAMLLTGGKLTVALVTTHIPLSEVPSALKQSEIVRVGLLLLDFLLCLPRRSSAEAGRSNKAPRIAVAGLNPHAGESGKIGREEIEIIIPAIAELREKCGARSTIDGPASPDTIFHRAAEGEFDAVLCMYHDQGLIPLKLHAFHDGVNTTLGLPFPRTSPDHGTAFAIAGKGIARADSMIAAIKLAVELTQKKS